MATKAQRIAALEASVKQLQTQVAALKRRVTELENPRAYSSAYSSAYGGDPA